MSLTLSLMIVSVSVAAVLATTPAIAQEPRVTNPSPVVPEPAAPCVISQDTILDPSRTYRSILIQASNVTVDGQGAWIIGAPDQPANSERGVAVFAKGVSGVTLKNLNAKGWSTGLHVVDGRDWTIENCNFSDNFHDPGFGWGENGRRGGILLEHVSHSLLRGNKANRVWDACALVGSNDNRLESNDFSHTSNTGLKLWNSSRNSVRRNDFSYGIRIDPGEVHARDSSSVLIESGSNNNQFEGNDCRYGGDGIFVRVLNGWVSSGNVFKNNDCSYANNNCIEAWAPRNTWIGNKANHGSYGFWLGASDQNVLINNEASFNGLPDGRHNSPHLPDDGHAGIVFMFGPSSHTIVRGNHCEGNHGAGIAAIGDLESQGQKWHAFHWIIEQNTLKANRWGIYLQHAKMIDLAANHFEHNSVADVHQSENVVGLVQRRSNPIPDPPPRAVLEGPQVVRRGDTVIFDASKSHDPNGHPLQFRWWITPDGQGDQPTISHSFPAPGFHRVALTVHNGLLSDLAWRDLYVIENTAEVGTESADGWSWIDDASTVQFTADRDAHLVGQASLRADVNPYGGGRVTLRHLVSGPAISVRETSHLVFWLKGINANVPAWQDVNPRVAMTDDAGQTCRLTPNRDLMSAPAYNEAREGWSYVRVPLKGDPTWTREGDRTARVRAIELGFDSWGGEPLVIWVDGLGFESP